MVWGRRYLPGRDMGWRPGKEEGHKRVTCQDRIIESLGQLGEVWELATSGDHYQPSRWCALDWRGIDETYTPQRDDGHRICLPRRQLEAKDPKLGQFLTSESYRQIPGKVAGGKRAVGDTALHGTEASAQHTSGWDILSRVAVTWRACSFHCFLHYFIMRLFNFPGKYYETDYETNPVKFIAHVHTSYICLWDWPSHRPFSKDSYAQKYIKSAIIAETSLMFIGFLCPEVYKKNNYSWDVLHVHGISMPRSM